eukprot:TRINITY_DN2398_c1_g1_i1.p1 TRINITY_DN2398_c1_g1~~TRINITY_DN2398_c1_g1_i1.p1  ORF type:complete len:541 (+),score=92.77 TRINITY_DN2398_c1_g1_i1:54-1676(+)
MVRTSIGNRLSETNVGAAELERRGCTRQRHSASFGNISPHGQSVHFGGTEVAEWPAPPGVNEEADPKTSYAINLKTTQSVIPPVAMEPSESSPRPRSSVFDFSDTEAMKQRVREALLKAGPYNVANFYYKTGLWQKIARHSFFENFTLFVISLNAVWMWIETDYNSQTSLLVSDWQFQVAEQFFCVYFSFEWTVRFMAFEVKKNGMKDGWFVFDSILVTMMFIETWIFSFVAIANDSYSESPLGDASTLRLLRLLRLSRLMRMLRGVPEIMVLLKGIATAMKSVSYVMGLLFIITFVFGIAFTQLAGKDPVLSEFFQTVPMSIYSLFIYGTFLDDLAYFCDSIMEHKPSLFAILVPFIGIACLTVMNMLVGVLCEVVCAVAATEKETILTNKVYLTMSECLNDLDIDGNGTISFMEFKRLVDYPQALKAVTDIGVDPISMVDFAEIFFIEDGEPKDITFEEFMEMVLDLRGANKATVKDIMNLWRQINGKMAILSSGVSSLTAKTNAIEKDLFDSTHRIDKQLDVAVQQARQIRAKFGHK